MTEAPLYFDSFDHAQLLRDFPLGDDFTQRHARLSADEIRARQDALFQRCVARAWQVPFYQRLWGAVGIEPHDVRSLDDIGKLPVFGKSDLMRSLAEHPPWGDYHGWEGAPGTRPVTVVHTTSGTTGRPQVVLFSPKSREVQALLVARVWRMQGLRPDDVVHSVYGHGMINGGHFVREAALHYTQSLFLSAGTGKETRSVTQIELMRDLRVTVLVGFVDYIRQLAETAREMGLEPGRDLAVRAIFGHVGRESRAALSRAWGGAEVYDWYGVADTGPIAAEGPDRDGMYVMEDAQYLEIVDESTGRTVSDATPGDMVVTSLYRDDIYPLIRFNTRDLSAWRGGASALGWNLRRTAGVLGRSDNMVKLRGINVYPLALAAILNDRPEFAGEYICRARRAGDGRDEMTVVIETKADAARTPELAAAFAALLSQRVGVQMQVELVAPGATAPLTQVDSRQKPLRLIDERPKNAPA
ncbi:MAG: phenylacetate--CoA ligase family protein [Gammaproteobacteria bacterium]|nr:phenylacetate--CoA ligase family protein [Gammaproteobacteria bacterium]